MGLLVLGLDIYVLEVPLIKIDIYVHVYIHTSQEVYVYMCIQVFIPLLVVLGAHSL